MYRMKNTALLMALVLVTGSILPAIAAGASAVGNSGYTRASLVGLRGVYVAVQPIPSEIEEQGFTAEQIQTDTQRLLRTAGIRVLAKEEWIKTKGGPVCFVAVDIVEDKLITGVSDQSLYAFEISVELNQDVFLVRNPAIRVLSPTWSTSYLGLTNTLPRIRENTKKLVQRFIDAFQTVNQR